MMELQQCSTGLLSLARPVELEEDWFLKGWGEGDCIDLERGGLDLEGAVDPDNLVRGLQPGIYETVRSRDHGRPFQFSVDDLWPRLELRRASEK